MDTFLGIIHKNCEAFITAVKMFADMNQSKPQKNRMGGFPIFYSQNRKYYEQVFLEETIENYTWFYLVNSILKELFEKGCAINQVDIIWPNINRQMATSVVDNIEKIYPFEFYITDTERIGYRYTDCSYSEERLDKMFETHNIDKAVILDFSSESVSTFSFNPMFSPKYIHKINVIPFEGFFVDYFGESAYEIYKKEISNIVEEAYDYVGIESVSSLSVQHLPFFVDSMLDEISRTQFDSKQYRIMKNHRDLKQYQRNNLSFQENTITSDDYLLMNQSFFGKGRYLAIAGKADFAKSFITSEYLYQTLKDNNVFDYTAIVSGYLKAIEQLLNELMLFRLTHNDGSNDLYIKKNSKKVPERKKNEIIFRRNTQHIEFKEDNKNYFDTTFAPLVNFMNDDIQGWDVSEGAKTVITTYLGIYCDECRNEHFHKDNIDSIDEVEIIRDNTLLLLYYVLGGYKLFGDRDADAELLKIVDRKFDRMYRAIHKHSKGVFYRIEFADGVSTLVALPSKQKPVQYDRDGVLEEKLIRFVKVDAVLKGENLWTEWKNIESDTSSDRVILLTPESNVTRIMAVNTFTEEETEIFW